MDPEDGPYGRRGRSEGPDDQRDGSEYGDPYPPAGSTEVNDRRIHGRRNAAPDGRGAGYPADEYPTGDPYRAGRSGYRDDADPRTRPYPLPDLDGTDPNGYPIPEPGQWDDDYGARRVHPDDATRRRTHPEETTAGGHRVRPDDTTGGHRLRAEETTGGRRRHRTGDIDPSGYRSGAEPGSRYGDPDTGSRRPVRPDDTDTGSRRAGRPGTDGGPATDPRRYPGYGTEPPAGYPATSYPPAPAHEARPGYEPAPGYGTPPRTTPAARSVPLPGYEPPAGYETPGYNEPPGYGPRYGEPAPPQGYETAQAYEPPPPPVTYGAPAGNTYRAIEAARTEPVPTGGKPGLLSSRMVKLGDALAVGGAAMVFLCSFLPFVGYSDERLVDQADKAGRSSWWSFLAFQTFMAPITWFVVMAALALITFAALRIVRDKELELISFNTRQLEFVLSVFIALILLGYAFSNKPIAYGLDIGGDQTMDATLSLRFGGYLMLLFAGATLAGGVLTLFDAGPTVLPRPPKQSQPVAPAGYGGTGAPYGVDEYGADPGYGYPPASPSTVYGHPPTTYGSGQPYPER